MIVGGAAILQGLGDELVADRIFLRCAHPDFPAKAARLLGQAPDVLELGQIAGLRREAEGVDDHAGLLGGLDHGFVVVAGIVGVAVAQDDQGFAAPLLLGQLADGLERPL